MPRNHGLHSSCFLKDFFFKSIAYQWCKGYTFYPLQTHKSLLKMYSFITVVTVQFLNSIKPKFSLRPLYDPSPLLLLVPLSHTLQSAIAYCLLLDCCLFCTLESTATKICVFWSFHTNATNESVVFCICFYSKYF